MPRDYKKWSRLGRDPGDPKFRFRTDRCSPRYDDIEIREMKKEANLWKDCATGRKDSNIFVEDKKTAQGHYDWIMDSIDRYGKIIRNIRYREAEICKIRNVQEKPLYRAVQEIVSKHGTMYCCEQLEERLEKREKDKDLWRQRIWSRIRELKVFVDSM